VETQPLTSLSIAAFLDALAEQQPAPGGGAAAALAAAAGAGLMAMVCRYTVGREKYAQWSAEVEPALQHAEETRRYLQAMIDADAGAFANVAAAQQLPRSTRDERAARRRAIDEALIAASEPPLQVATHSATLASLAVSLIGKTNASLVSDLGAAGELLAAGLAIAAFNVQANVAGLKADSRAEGILSRFAAARAQLDLALAELRPAVDRALASEG